MKMKSTSGKAVKVSNDAGHSTWVETTWTEVPAHLVRDAVAAYCVPQGAESEGFSIESKINEDTQHKQKIKIVMNAVRQIKLGNDPDDFTSAGDINLKKLQRKAGVFVDREEMSEALFAIDQEEAVAKLPREGV